MAFGRRSRSLPRRAIGAGARPTNSRPRRSRNSAPSLRTIWSRIPTYCAPRSTRSTSTTNRPPRKSGKKSSPIRPARCFSSKFQATVGNPKGTATLVEFFDYNCHFCKGALPDIARLMKDDPNLKLVLKDFPVLGPGSVEAARVATAARNQLPGDKFWAFHSKLLTMHGPIGKAEALSVARDLGLDMDKLAKDMESPEIEAGLHEVMAMADFAADQRHAELRRRRRGRRRRRRLRPAQGQDRLRAQVRPRRLLTRRESRNTVRGHRASRAPRGPFLLSPSFRFDHAASHRHGPVAGHYRTFPDQQPRPRRDCAAPAALGDRPEGP